MTLTFWDANFSASKAIGAREAAGEARRLRRAGFSVTVEELAPAAPCELTEADLAAWARAFEAEAARRAA